MFDFAGGDRRAVGTALALLSAASIAACGAEKSADIDEKAGTFEVEITKASFAQRQSVAAEENLVLTVRNAGDREIPQLAVTVSTRDSAPDSAQAHGSFEIQLGEKAGAESRPVWVPTAGFPKVLAAGASVKDISGAAAGGSVAAQAGTFVFGRLAAGATQTLVWRVTPVRPGSYDVTYTVSAGVGGAAKAVTTGGGPARGSFRVDIGSASARRAA